MTQTAIPAFLVGLALFNSLFWTVIDGAETWWGKSSFGKAVRIAAVVVWAFLFAYFIWERFQ